jgi:transglutaminase-like putative cysteine protease
VAGGWLPWLAVGLLTAAAWGVAPFSLLGGLSLSLLLLTALKLREAKQRREYRLVCLLQLVTAGLLGAQQAELGSSLLQGLAVLVALAGLLQLELVGVSNLGILLRRSGQLVLAALPMALVLFLLFPRLGPFANLGGLGQFGAAATTGLSTTLEPGTIATLTQDRSPAARVAFPGGGPPPTSQRLWRVLVHGQFDGQSWRSLNAGNAGPGIAGASTAGTSTAGTGIAGTGIAGTGGTDPNSGATQPPVATQVWLSEPNNFAEVPWSGAGLPLDRQLKLDDQGQLRYDGAVGARKLYSIAAEPAAPAWRRQVPTAQDLQMSAGTNPRLESLAASWRRQAAGDANTASSAQAPSSAKAANGAKAVALAEAWFRQQGFRYSLNNPLLPQTAPLDALLFERRQGFCGHYASALSALMRAAGVPARVVSGYRGGTWVVPLGGSPFLDLRQSDAHAWSEVWIEGEGWRTLDPTLWVLGGPTLADASSPSAPATAAAADRAGPLDWIARQWWGLDLAWGQWWLGFDQRSQELLLQRLLGPYRDWAGVLLVGAVALTLALGLAAYGWLRRRGEGDRLQQELNQLLRSCARRGLVPQPGETVSQFGRRLRQARPLLGPELEDFVGLLQQLRYGRPGDSQRQLMARLRRCGQSLRQQLRRSPS